MVVSAKGFGPPDPAANNGEQGQDHQWHKHHFRTLTDPAVTVPMWRGLSCPRTLMSMRIVGSSAVLAKERHEPKPEHIKGGEKRRNNTDQPIHPTGLISTPENFIFTEESSQRKDASDGDCSNGHRPKCPGDLFSQAAHPAHVLLTTYSVDH